MSRYSEVVIGMVPAHRHLETGLFPCRSVLVLYFLGYPCRCGPAECDMPSEPEDPGSCSDPGP